VVALAVEDVGDQLLVAGVLDPGVEVTGPRGRSSRARRRGQTLSPRFG
jgi:hypothetical protein